MDNASDKDIIRRRDVPWHRNGTIMKYIFMVAGLSMIFGVYIDPEFSDARPGLLDALIGLISGSLCGRAAGRLMARAFERDTRDRLSMWQEAWRHRFDLKQFAVNGLFLLAALSAGVVGACLSNALHLGFPWFGKVELMSIGAVFMATAFYVIAMARAVERWYLSLPE